MRKFNVGYYPEFRLPENLPIPKKLEERIKLTWNAHYHDFNEGQASVMDECYSLLDYFGSPGKTYSTEHKRYVFMALAFALSGKPILERLRPNDTRASYCLGLVEKWLKKYSSKIEDWSDVLFPERSTRIGGTFLDEAFDNFYSLVKMLNPNNASHEMLDILYDAFTGEWCGGSVESNRDTFNWWLIEVIPAAYNLQLPPTIRPVIWKFPFRCETPEMFTERMKELEDEEDRRV